MSTDDKPYRYISYVTLREAYGEVKGFFIAWLLLSGISVAFGTAIDWGVSNTESVWRPIPNWLWYVGIFAAVTWAMRGKEIKYRFPSLTFVGWAAMSLAVGVFALAAANLPTWATIPMYFGIAMCFAAADNLATLGRDNYLKLSERANATSDGEP